MFNIWTYHIFTLLMYYIAYQKLRVEIYNEKILIVSGDSEINKLLSSRLTVLGYKVFSTFTGENALIFFNREEFDLIVIDLVLAKFDGYEVCSKIRENSKVPIILLNGLTSVENRIIGLELGADDYLVKPFSSKELEARIRSLLRRYNQNSSTSFKRKKRVFQIGNLFIDMNTRIISKNNSKIKLTSIEHSILELLIENAGKKLSRVAILDNIWGYTPERYVDTRIVDVHISRLRLKIEEDPKTPDLIITVRGIGYMFQLN